MWHQRETELCSELKRRAQDGSRCHGQQPRRTRSATASNVWNRDSLAVIEETRELMIYLGVYPVLTIILREMERLRCHHRIANQRYQDPSAGEAAGRLCRASGTAETHHRGCSPDDKGTGITGRRTRKRVV